nr:cache domain-containing protein [Lachnospiraceae bacterium]
MSQNETGQKKKSEYEELHKTVIVSEHLNASGIVVPIIVIIMIIAVMCMYTYIQRRNTIKNAEQVTDQMAEYIAGNIANEMDYAKSSIRFASSSLSHLMTSETIQNPREIITPMIVNSPFDKIEYIRADGMNVMNIGEPFDASDRVYYIEGIKGKTGVWNNYHPKTSQETLMNFYTPIVYKGRISGVLTGYIAATTQLSPLFEKKLYGQDIYGLVVDEADMVICSTIESEYIKDLSLELFMDQYGIAKDQRQAIYDTIDNAKEDAATYKDSGGEGRICVAKIPETDWKVVIIVPEESINAIISENTRNSIITIIIVGLILFSYGASVLWKNVKRRREIAKENEKLEEENRIFNEENKRAFEEISAIRDIIASANMGTWRFEMVDGERPRMYADDTMKNLMGILGMEKTPEETYDDWYGRISPQAVPSVLKSVEKMKQGKFDENTYLWNHPAKGERYVRCGGTAKEIPNGYLVSGYHYDVDDVVREDLAKVVMLQDALSEKNDYYNTLGTLAGVYNSLHVIDLVENTVAEFSAGEKDEDAAGPKQGAKELIREFMIKLTDDEHKERALEYTDLKTLSDRMRNKKQISTQLISDSIGWFLASFITMETDEAGRPKRVIFTTQSIDEVKKQEEKLINRSRTDELT